MEIKIRQSPFRKSNRWHLVGIFKIIIACGALLLLATVADAEDKTDPSVGAAGWIDQLVLPGTELEGKPLDPQDEMVVRITRSFPHGEAFRYDIQFHGMEPGKFDLKDWLVRKDGSSTEDLPEIPVEIRSLLPPGQIEPNELESGWLPSLGGYKNIAVLVTTGWIVVFLLLIFAGRKKPEIAQETIKPKSLAELLHARLEAATSNNMDPKKYAELERMLFAFWSKRLNLENLSPEKAMTEIKQHKDAGPLMVQLEKWMHSPTPDPNVDLGELVQPFKDLPADTAGFEA